jgi:hypothetical protein
MKKQFVSQSGWINLRLPTGSVLLAVGILTLAGSFGLQAAAKNDPFPTVPTVAAPAVGRTQAQTKGTTDLPSKRYNLQVDLSQVTYNLGPLNLNSVTRKKPNQVGVSRTTEISSTTQGQRFNNPDGTRILFLVIKSPGAVGIRVHFDHFELRAGDEVYVYGPSKDNTAAGPYRGTGPWKNKEFWSAIIEGDTAIIEYYNRGSGGYFNIPGISHIYREEHTRPLSLSPDVLSCEVDASCNSDTVMNGVGRITFVKNGDSFVCTGTLLNDRARDFIPYLLTANHCVSTQDVAQTVETYWFYQTTACNSGVLRSDIVHSTSGANLMATETAKDFTLLRLMDDAPAGSYFSGWNSSPVALNTPVYGFHHPGGDIPPGLASFLRRADGAVDSTSYSCSASGLLSAYRVTWTSGLTEPGSSGSGLWSSGFLVGVLSCGPQVPSCSNPYGTYSKFADFYPLIQPYIDPQTVHLPFFNGEIALGGGWYYVQFANGTPFGYYSYLSDQHFIYHIDLGFEYFIDANDVNHGIYFYDFASSSFFYTSPSTFPFLYDFSLNAWLYYLPDVNNSGRYTHNPRWFYNFATGQWITL